MKSDIEIARSCNMKPIEEVAATVGIPADALEHYGKYMAKVPLSLIDEDRVACNRLVQSPLPVLVLVKLQLVLVYQWHLIALVSARFSLYASQVLALVLA